MELTEFLRARLDEDEAAAYGLCGNGPLARWVIRDGDIFVGTEPLPDEPIVQTWDGRVAQHIARHDPARVLREVEAKRKLLNEWRAVQKLLETTGSKPDPYRNWVLRHLATAWSDHPDYRDEWKPWTSASA